MKRLTVPVTLGCVIGLIIWFKGHHATHVSPARTAPPAAETEKPLVSDLTERADSATPPSQARRGVLTASLPGPVLPTAKPIALAAAVELPAQLETAQTPDVVPVVTALENMRTMFRAYHQRFGENPVGDNAEITAALTGKNPKQVNFVSADDGMHVNDKGQLVDNWDTPYFFHQLSRTEMEIHSAGPDRKMWTADDLVLK